MTTTKKLWIGIGILVLLSPFGLIIPALFGADGAWGEWGVDDVEKMIGYVPEGMKKLAERWKAPMPGYSVPGQSRGLAGGSIGYVLAALLGVAITAGLAWLLATMLGGRKK